VAAGVPIGIELALLAEIAKRSDRNRSLAGMIAIHEAWPCSSFVLAMLTRPGHLVSIALVGAAVSFLLAGTDRLDLSKMPPIGLAQRLD
jgi:hypothetical protein